MFRTSILAAAIAAVRHFSIPVLLLALLSATASPAAAQDANTPKVHAGFPHWGESPRIIEYSWSQLPFELVNPTDQERTFQLSVRPKQAEGMVFSKTLRISPRTSYNDTMLMTGSHTRAYEGILTDESGAMLMRQEIRSEFENAFQKRAIFFINNNYDIEGVSDVKKNSDLINNVTLTRSAADDVPVRWAGFGGASIICIIEPEYHTMNALQFEAIFDFVESGGTLLFVSPEGALHAAETPLSEILPVQPLRVRRIEILPELERWARLQSAESATDSTEQNLVWPAGASFLESTPVKEAVVTLSSNEFPIFAWQRYGLGSVGVCTVSPFTDPIRHSDLTTAVWDHLLSYSQEHPLTNRSLYTEPLKAASQRLIGFQVPGVDTIKVILTGYFLAICFVFVLGILLRRHVSAWILNVAVGVILTGLIFSAAYRQLKNQPRKNITTVDLRCQGLQNSAGEKLVNIFSKVDGRPTIRAQDTDIFFRAPPPAPSPVPITPDYQMLMQIDRRDGISSIPRLGVHALKRTPFAAVYTGPRRETKAEPAVVQLSEEFPELISYALPQGVPATAQSYLVFAGGIVRLRLEDGVYRTDYGGKRALELDPVTAKYEEFLQSGLLPDTCVAFLYRQPRPSSQYAVAPDTYDEIQHVIDVRPAVIRSVPGTVRLVPQQVIIEPFSKNARALYWGNRWQETFLHGEQTHYEFAATLPAVVRDIKLSQLSVDLDISNPAGNLKIDVRLVDAEALLDPDGNRRNAMFVKADSVNGSAFTFSNIGGRRIVDPRTGRVLLRLTVRSDRAEAELSQLQAEKWRVRDFRVTAVGELPASSHPKRY